MTDNITVKVFRYNPALDDKPCYQTYKVPYEEGMVVLDALNYVHSKLDGTLAYRSACRAGQCGSCAVIINGKPGVACRTKIEKGQTLNISPLLQFPVVKDLVVDLEKGLRRMRKIRPYVERRASAKRPEIISKEQIEQVKAVRDCIECWACISACPVVAEAWYEFSGPLIHRQLARLAMDHRDIEDRVKMAFLEGLYDCTTCRACVTVCPKKIDIPRKVIEKMRVLAAKSELGPLEGQKAFINNIVKTGRSVSKQGASLLEQLPEVIDVPNPVDEVVFFTGCLVDYRDQQTGLNMIEVLKKNRIRVHVPKAQSSCGSPAFRAGALDVAYTQVEKNVDVLEKTGANKVVGMCAGCTMTLKEDFPRVKKELGKEPPKYRVYEFCEYLVNEIGIKNLNTADLGELNMTVTYHDPCHLNRGQGIHKEPRQLIQLIPGIKFVEMEESDRCCGAGGGVRSGRRNISTLLARRKAEFIIKSGADAVVTECPFCSLQIREILNELGYEKIEVYNVPDLLALSYQKGVVQKH